MNPCSLISFDPTQDLKGGPRQKKEIRFLTEEEFAALVGAAADEQTRVILRLTVQTGMRAGEIGALTWADL